MRLFFTSFILILLVLSPPGSAEVKEVSGRVVDVLNGDTILLQDSHNKQYRIYLFGIDAPEPGQTSGQEARAYLDRLLFTRTYRAKVVYSKRTKAGNIIGTVYAAELNSNQYADINGMMVMAGYAWASQRHGKRYRAIEQMARNRKIGLWAEPRPLPPWEWRAKHER